MTKELVFILDLFPAYQMRIIELYDHDQDFRQLCNDYCLSINMVEAFKKTKPDLKKVEMDYKKVAEDLKKELLHFFAGKN